MLFFSIYLPNPLSEIVGASTKAVRKTENWRREKCLIWLKWDKNIWFTEAANERLMKQFRPQNLTEPMTNSSNLFVKTFRSNTSIKTVR